MKHTFCVYRGQRVFLCFRCWYLRKTRYVVLRAPKYFIMRCLFIFIRSCFVLLEVHSLFQISLWKASNSPLKSFKEFKFKKHSNRLYSSQCDISSILFKKNFMAPFRFNCLKSTEPLQGGSLLFISQFREIPGTHLINLGRMKDWLDLGVTWSLWTQDHWIGNPVP